MLTPRLLGDIGATNVRFALCEKGHRPGDAFVHECASYRGLDDAIEACLEEAALATPPTEAVCAVAGPVTGDRVDMTNHPWQFSIRGLERQLGLERLTVINDFTAIALSLPWLQEEDRRQIGGGRPIYGQPLGVLGPGSGLGVSGLIASEAGWVPLAGEGGHVEFAPQTETELEILRALGGTDHHLSIERLLSGPGLIELHRILGGEANASAEAITEFARAGAPQASQAITVFSEILGAVAGNLALTLGARGGIFIAGGIVPKLGPCFDEAAFRRRFEAKGRLSDYVAAVPTYLITTAYPALIGLAHQ